MTPESKSITCSDTPTPTPTYPSPQAAYDDLSAHVHKWFFRPDMEAVRVVLAAAASHYVIKQDPIWLFVTGPASSGKTTIVVNSIRELPKTHILGSLTPKTLLSQYKGVSNAALLHRIGKSGIICFKDFTTFLSMREDDRKIIASQLREVYDGEFRNDSGMGNSDGAVLWTGKITVLGVCTSTLDRAWEFRREMGERFLQVRWPRVDGVKMGLAAAEQRGNEAGIYGDLQTLASRFVFPTRLRPAKSLEAPWRLRIAALAEFTARARGAVIRDSHAATRPIIEVPPAEQSPRLHKQLELLVDTHAQLFDRDVCADDFQIAARVAFDSIPIVRSAILRAVTAPGGMAQADLPRLINIHPTTVEYNLDELLAIDAVRIEHTQMGNVVTLSEWAEELITMASPVLGSLSVSRGRNLPSANMPSVGQGQPRRGVWDDEDAGSASA